MERQFETLFHFKWFVVTYRECELHCFSEPLKVRVISAITYDDLPLDVVQIKLNPVHSELLEHINGAMKNNAESSSFDQRLFDTLKNITA